MAMDMGVPVPYQHLEHGMSVLGDHGSEADYACRPQTASYIEGSPAEYSELRCRRVRRRLVWYMGYAEDLEAKLQAKDAEIETLRGIINDRNT